MTPSRLARLLLLPATLAAMTFGFTADAPAQGRKKAFPKGEADALLKPKPRPRWPALAPSELPLEFINAERIAFVGHATAERMKTPPPSG